MSESLLGLGTGCNASVLGFCFYHFLDFNMVKKINKSLFYSLSKVSSKKQ